MGTVENLTGLGCPALLSQQLDVEFGGGGSAFRVFDSISDLDALTGSYPALVYLTSYNSAYPGIGAGTWYFDSTSTRTPNSYIRQPAGISGAGRYLPKFLNGQIDITMGGARDGTTNDAAFQDALTLQQDETWPDKVVFVPSGRYRITQTLDVTGTRRRFILRGVNRGDKTITNPVRYEATSTIEMVTNNIPIIEHGYMQDSIRDVQLAYNTIQTTSDTNAIAIWTDSNAGTIGINDYTNIEVNNCYRALYAPNASGYVINSSIDNFRVSGFAGTAIELGSTTTWQLRNIYVNNAPPTLANRVNFNNIAVSGTQVTFTTTGPFPPNLKVNSQIGVRADDNNFDVNEIFVKAISGANVTVDYLSARPAPTALTGDLLFAAAVSAGPALLLPLGCEASLTGVDVEWTQCPDGIVIDCAGMISFDQLHIEKIFTTTTNWRPIRQSAGSLHINQLTILNCGAQSGGTNHFIYKTGASGTSINQLAARDIGNTGATINVAGASSTAFPEVRIMNYTDLGTVRANAASIFPRGPSQQVMASIVPEARRTSGTATLVAGSATVALPWVTANTQISTAIKTKGGTVGFLDTNTRSAGVSFTITSSSGTDTSVITWEAWE